MTIRPRTVLVALFGIAASVLLLPGRSLAGDAAVDGLAPGTAAPSFVLPVVNDYAVKRWGPGKWTGSDAETPKKLVILSFFATYCDPCKKEMPELVRLWEKYESQGLGILLVSIDKGQDQRDEVVALAKQNGVLFPVVHDRFQVVARRYGAERLPYMLMLGADGVVKRVHIGYTDELKAALENEVRAELGLEPLPNEVASVKGKAPSKSKSKSKRGRK